MMVFILISLKLPRSSTPTGIFTDRKKDFWVVLGDSLHPGFTDYSAAVCSLLHNNNSEAQPRKFDCFFSSDTFSL